MKLWSFLLTDPAWPLASARVAAPSRQEACDLMSVELEEPLNGFPGAKPAPGIICVYAGEVAVEEPGIVARVARVRP